MYEPIEAAGGASANLTEDEVRSVDRLKAAHARILAEIRKVIVGQEQVIDEMMIAIFSRGHSLLVGVPGLAKTLLVSSLARTLSLSFKRIQFTPDLMPSDITGTEILQDDPATGSRRFKFLRGPVFANLILADEINRTPPKTQAALLEAMQEKKVSAGGEDHALEEPFFVLATQNPIEQEGTYPLPEAQLDRFLFNILVAYPSWEEEIEIMKRISGDFEARLDTILGRDEIIALQSLVRRAPVADHIFNYAAMLVRASRPGEREAPGFIRRWLSYGAGPRASLFLIVAGKARAILRGRYHVSIGDVQAVAPPVLRHRIIPNFAARSEGLSPDDIVAKLLETIPTDERLYEGGKAPAPAAVS
jgi:MoxR-like ATPase